MFETVPRTTTFLTLFGPSDAIGTSQAAETASECEVGPSTRQFKLVALTSINALIAC
jgi:hypothetical protein